MRARYKGPSGTGVIELPDDATVQTVFNEIEAKTGISRFSLKHGPPMAMQALDRSQDAESARSLGLHGETLTIVPDEARPISPVQKNQESNQSAPMRESSSSQVQPQASEDPGDITVPWPQREGTVLLRVMPSDNSCLFTAFGGALPQQIPAPRLRKMMADYIDEHSDVYTEAVLGSAPVQYRRSIQDTDRWGGGIELSILSAIFDIQICTYDVQGQNLMKFGEDKKDRCILVYSGIHYDRVVFSYTDHPHTDATLPPEMDRTVWPVEDDDVLQKAQDLVGKLNRAHYYTDTEGLVLRCDVPGCDWIGSGQLEGRKHAEQTGHVDMSEIRDSEEDNVLRTCDTPGCEFMGQGDRMRRQHKLDTGHDRFSIIPDH